MKELLKAALGELEADRTPVLVSIAASQGSTPRTTGAAMVVGEAGRLAGTIGGGELEYACTNLALSPEQPLMEFSLDNTQAAELGMVCGGSAQVLFTKLTDAALLGDALALAEGLAPGWLVLPLDGSAPTLQTEGLPPDAAVVVGNLSLPLASPGRVYLMGGGHVSQALAGVLDLLGWPYIVVDDREEFASKVRFPGAKRAMAADFARLDTVLTGHLAPQARDCICIMTRGHLADTDALRFSLRTPAGYIGLMGSQKKRERVFAQLDAEGFRDAPSRISTPIGLAIGGQTPAEIAISIAAQLVQHRNCK